MFPSSLITVARIGVGVEVSSKKRLLESVAAQLAADQSDLVASVVFERLLERERLGSTGLGQGVALPHARTKLVAAPLGAFVQVRGAVPFDAIDDQPVDLAFGLLVPEAATDEALQLLAHLAGMFSDEGLRAALREAPSAERLQALLIDWSPRG